MPEKMKDTRFPMKLLPLEGRRVLLLSEYCAEKGIPLSNAKRLKNPVTGQWCEVLVRFPDGTEEKLGEGEFFTN